MKKENKYDSVLKNINNKSKIKSYKFKVKIHSINHKKTQICTDIERDFLKSLDGGCSSPIAAEAEIVDNILKFNGGIFNYEQNEKKVISKKITNGRYKQIGFLLANEMKKLMS